MKSDPIYFAELCRALLEEGKTVEFLASGTSMRPFIPPQTCLRVKKVPLTQYTLGDVVFYQSANEQLISHRLVKICRHASGRTEFITAADNETMGLSRVSEENILGKVMLHQGPMGRGQRICGLLWYMLRPLRRLKRSVQTRLSSLVK